MWKKSNIISYDHGELSMIKSYDKEYTIEIENAYKINLTHRPGIGMLDFRMLTKLITFIVKPLNPI